MRAKSSNKTYDYRTLLTHRILVLSNTLGKGAVQLYAERYGVQLAEWRLLAALMADAPPNVNGLANALATDKGWVSRTTASLARKGLITKRSDSNAPRRVKIELTEAGLDVYRKILPAATARQECLTEVLTAEERETFESALAKLQERATLLLMAEKAPSTRPAKRRASVKSGNRSASGIRVDVL